MRHELKRLLPYVEETLNAGDRATVERHVQGCVTCAHELDALRRGTDAMRGLKVPALSAPTVERIIASARSAAHTRSVSARLSAGRLIAAGLLLVAAGGMGGYSMAQARQSPPSIAQTTIGDSSFMLILLEPDTEWPARRRTMQGSYREWVRELRADRRMISGEKLSDDAGAFVAPDSIGALPASPIVSGVFVIRAANYAEATSVARKSPHLQFGGRILVRQIN